MEYAFGEPTMHITPTDKARRKRKRQFNVSDDDVEQELDKRLPYRRGHPALPPMPLSTLTTGIYELIPDEADVLAELDNMLEAQQIRVYEKTFAFRTPRHVARSTTTADLAQFLTFLITIDFVEDGYRADTIAIRTRAVLKKYVSTQDAYVEIIHHTAINSLHTYPITSDDTQIISHWREVEAMITADLGNERWLCFELVRRSLDSQNVKQGCPTVVITSPTAAKAEWYDSIIPSLKEKLRERGAEFGVEILYARSLFAVEDELTEPSSFIDQTLYAKETPMGSSIGPDTDKAGGTLGGVVTLEGGEAYAISNWHVVERKNLTNMVNESRSKALEPNNEKLETQPQTMLVPATADHEDFVKKLEVRVRKFQQEVESGEDESEELRREAQELLDQVQSTDRVVGKVAAGSGYRTVFAPKYATNKSTGEPITAPKDQCTEFPLDWSLTSIANPANKDPRNRLPSIATSGETQLQPRQLCNKWSSFDVQRHWVPVGKYGRSSGWTFGAINSVLTKINPRNDSDISKKFGFTADFPGTCYSIVPNDRSFHSQMVLKGDSGSIAVHDGTGTWLGLIFGVTGGGWGMMIPIDLVFQDIEKVTGKKVVSPKWIRPEEVGLAKEQLEPHPREG